MKFYQKILFVTFGSIGLIFLLFLIWSNYSDIINTLSTYDRQNLVNLLRHQGKHNALLFMAVIAIGSAIPGVPIAAVAILSGVCFGNWLGFSINVIGTVCGNILAIYILGSFPHKIHQSKFRPLADKLKSMRHPRIGLSIGYAVPMLPTLLVNYASLELNMSFKNKLSCIFLGSLPVSFLYAFGGNQLLFGNTRNVIIAACLVILLFGLYEVIRRDQRIRSKDESEI